MRMYVFVLLAVTIQLLPLSLRACDCEEGPVGLGIVHFRDGRSPTAPVTGGYAAGDTEGGCGCSSTFTYRDYGPAHVPEPAPTPALPPKRPAS